MTRSARLPVVPLNAAARLMLGLRERAKGAPMEPADQEDPLAAIIRCIEDAPGSRQSLAAVTLMCDIVRNMASPKSTPETLEQVSDELAALVALFSERYQTDYLDDPRLARFRLVKHHRLA